MRLLMIRHGDPDYIHDALTPRGRREAQALAKHISALRPGTIYLSPLGRAQETASYSLKALGAGAETLPWLQEFVTDLDLNRHPELREAYGDTPKMADLPADRKRVSLALMLRPESGRAFMPDENGRVPTWAPRIFWDMYPSYYASHPELMNPDTWRDSDLARAGDIPYYYDYVTEHFDAFLREHGYERDGLLYRAVRPNEETVTFFCHLGLMTILMSHLWHLSPFVLLQSAAFAPTSVSEIVTEERQAGTAFFRGIRLGDISHLVLEGIEPSFSARFCETFDDKEERH